MRSLDDVLKIFLLLNGLGDLILGLILLLLSDMLASILGFQYSTEMQYLAGGWGIATLALGGWRVSASRSGNAWFVSTTAIFGIFEGGILSIFGIGMIASGRLLLQQAWLRLVFSSFFTVAYIVSFLVLRKNGGS